MIKLAKEDIKNMVIFILVIIICLQYSFTSHNGDDQYRVGYEVGAWQTGNYHKITDKYPCLNWRAQYYNQDLQTYEILLS